MFGFAVLMMFDDNAPVILLANIAVQIIFSKIAAPIKFAHIMLAKFLAPMMFHNIAVEIYFC